MTLLKTATCINCGMTFGYEADQGDIDTCQECMQKELHGEVRDLEEW